MAFTQFKLDRSLDQSRGIFNKYIYKTETDTIAEVTAAGYFDASRFKELDSDDTNSMGWSGGVIECQCSDGYFIGEISTDGDSVTTVISEGGSEIIDTLTDGQVPKKDDGTNSLIYAGATVDPSSGEWTFDQKANFPQGSVGIGEVMELSEGGTNVVVGDLLNNSMAFSVNSFFDDTTGASAPTWTAFTGPFNLPIQTDFSQVLTDNPLTYSLTSTVVSPDQRLIDKITFRANSAMTNISAEFVDNATGKVVKYLPSKAAFDGNVEGLDLVAGDNLFNLASQGTDSPGNYFLGFTPIILTDGQQLDITIKGDNIDLLGDLSGVPYQVAEAHDGQPQTVGTGTGDVVGPASAVDGGLAVYDGTSGTMIKSGSLITATTGGTNSNLIFTTTEAVGSGFFGLEFQDSDGNYLANIIYDEPDLNLEINSDDGVSINASGDAYLTAAGVLEIQSTGGTIDITSATTLEIGSQGNLVVQSTSGNLNLLASTTNNLISGTTDTAPLELTNTPDSLSSSVYLRATSPESQLTALPGSLCVVIDTTTPANNGLYQLHSTASANTPWELIGSAGTGDVSRSGSTRDGAIATWSGVDNSAIEDEGLAAISGDVMTFTPGSPANTYGIVMGSAVDGEIFMNGGTKELSVTSENGDVTISSTSSDASITGAGTATLGAGGEDLTYDGSNLTFGGTGIDQKIIITDAVFGYDDASTSTILGTNNDLNFQIINGDWNTTSQQGIEMLASTTLNLDCTAGNTIVNADTSLQLTGNTGQLTAAQALALESTNANITLDANNGEVQLSADSGNSALTLGANSTLASDVQLNIVGGAECSFGAGLSLNMSSTEGIYMSTGVDNQFPVTFINAGTGGGRCDQHVIDFDPDGVLTALNGAVAYRVDETTPGNIKEYRLKATGAGFFNTPWVEIGGAGNGDVTGPVSSVDTELALFSGTTGDVIQGGTNITAEVGNNNAKLDLNTTNNADDPEIWFNGAVSDQEGWIYLDASTDTFNVRGANSAQYTAGTKLDLSCDAGDVDIEAQSTSVNITGAVGANITASGASGITLSAPADNIGMFVSNDIVMFSDNDDTLQLQTLGQLGTNGGQYSVHVGDRDPQNQFGPGQGALYMRQGSNPSESDIYITDAGGVNNWVALKGGPALLEWGDGNIQTTTTDRFLTPGYDAGSAPTVAIQKTMTRRGFLEQLRIKCRVANGNGNNVAYTIQVNGLDTPLAVTLASNVQSGSNTTSRVQVSAGDFVTLKVSKAAGIGTSPQDVIADLNFL